MITPMKAYLAALRERIAPLENPYLKGLRDGSLSKEDFIETQIQFLFAVVFFSRPMTVLAARLPRPEMRWTVLENVSDEHGGGKYSLSHERTFLTLLARLGVNRADVERRALWPEVRAFNTVLAGLCTLDDTFTAHATLGIIEDTFAVISRDIGSSIVARGFLGANQLVHYKAHEELDVEHAEGFYSSLYAPYAEHPRHKYQIEQGLELGAHIFMRFYEDLYRARSRRVLRDVEGPHSLADGWYLDGVTPSMRG
jgi:pyrroloquinoline quinone (PQQ) biosynthesis protein C